MVEVSVPDLTKMVVVISDRDATYIARFHFTSIATNLPSTKACETLISI